MNFSKTDALEGRLLSKRATGNANGVWGAGFWPLNQPASQLWCLPSLFLLALLLASAPSLRAGGSEIEITFGKDKGNQPDAKSFEIDLKGVNKFMIAAKADGFTIRTAGTQPGGDFRLIVTKKNGAIADGEKITITLTGKDAAKADPGVPIWSDEKGNLIGTTDKSTVKKK